MSAVLPPRAEPAGKPAPEPTPRRARRAPSAPDPALARHRRLVALAALGVVLALASAGWLTLRGSGTAPPATGAARVVPADALAYVHLSIDSSRPSVQAARRLASRFPDYPLLYATVMNRLGAVLGGRAGGDLAAELAPWLGKEAALAVLGTSGATAQSLLVLDVSSRARAQAFLTSAGAAPAGAYDGVRLLAYPSGSEVALVGHYLVAGPDAGIRAAIAAERGRAPSLAGNPAYERAAASEPADRVLDAYLPAAGVARLLAGRTGLLGAIGVLLDRPTLAGTAISLSAVPGGARILVHSVKAGARSSGGSFTPTLQSVLPSGSTLMLDVDGLNRAGPELLDAVATAGIGANLRALLSRLGTALVSQGVSVRNVLSAFDGETAVALSPGPSPALLIVARVRSDAAASGELASLEGPLTSLFSPADSASAGQVPELGDVQVAGATIHELQLGPGLQVDDGVWNGIAVMSTSLTAIEAVAQRSRALGSDSAYQAAIPSGSGQVSSLLFGNFTQLLSFAEQTGLAGGSSMRELLPDLSKISAIGMSSTSGENGANTTLTLRIP